METRFAAALLDAALPKSKAMFGTGIAGSVAREALVNSIASAVTSSGALDIASSIDAKRASMAVNGEGAHQPGPRQT